MTERSVRLADNKQTTQNCNYYVNNKKLFKLFIVISIYRLANAWMIRTQFDPDEYWQTLEPAYCLAFSNETTTAPLSLHPQQKYGCALTWEWTRRKKALSPIETTQDTSLFQKIMLSAQTAFEQALHGPVRSYVSILPTYWYYIGCRSLFQWAAKTDDSESILNTDIAGNKRQSYTTKLISYTKEFARQQSTYLISKGPVFIHALTVAVPTDLSVWIIASRLERLAIHHKRNDITRSKPIKNATRLYWWQSWASCALFLAITSWFNGYALIRTYANSMETMLLMVGIALLGPELFGDVSVARDKQVYRHRMKTRLAFVLGGLSACVRFTSLAAWIPIGVIIVLRENATAKQKLGTLFELCAVNGLLGVALGCCVDRWVYGFWAIPFLGNFHFNAILGLGSLYGTHPMLWYIYAGVPAICGIALPMFLWDALLLLTKTYSRTNDGEGNRSRLTIFWIIASYTLLHSFSEHKEFRFLLPVFPLMLILAGHTMVELLEGMGVFQSILVLVALCLLNYPHLIYLGTVHQRGPIAANAFLASIMNKSTQQDKRNNQFSIHYLMGCHSAPAYSHLHVAGVYVDVDYLDCSPGCRSNKDLICESDAFSNDPYGYMYSTYATPLDGECEHDHSIDTLSSNESQSNVHSKQKPSFVVITQDDASKAEGILLDKWNATRVASVRHSITSISWHRPTRNSDVLSLLSLLDIHFEHMEIYSTL